MSDEKKDDGLISVFVNGQETRTKPGTNMIEVARSIGREIPHYCYHPKLSVSGNCRMCLVELGMPGRDRATGEPILNEDGTPKIMWMPNPAIACGTNAAPGMHIRTESELARKARNGVTEFILTNHPLDCPICDQAGECTLQEFSADYGRGFSRFIEQKNVKPKRTVLGPRVMLDDERCILCSRCIRFCQEIVDDDVLGFTDRGSYTTLTCYPGRKLENNYSLNTVDICPVGALTSRDFRFKMRVWFLKPVPSVDFESSVGCNTEVWCREGKIYRITPRRNDAVNDTWMPDSGRELYKQVEAEDRLTACQARGAEISPADAIAMVSEALQEEGVAIVASGHCSVEEQFLLKTVADAAGAQVYLPARYGDDDGILLSRDRTPNTRGALLTGLVDRLPEESLEALGAAIDRGEIRTVFAVREDLESAGLAPAQLDKVRVVALDTRQTAATRRAETVLAGLTQFEKAGTVVNQQFRIQKFHAAVPGPAGTVRDLVALAGIAANLSGEAQPSTLEAVWERLGAAPGPLAGLSFESIPSFGKLLDGSGFDHLPFVEGKSLHYEPKREETADAR